MRTKQADDVAWFASSPEHHGLYLPDQTVKGIGRFSIDRTFSQSLERVYKG